MNQKDNVKQIKKDNSVSDNLEKQSDKKVFKPLNLDIDKIIKKAQLAYSKGESGLAKQLTTGLTLTKLEDDDDFILWTENSMWYDLTHLRGLPFGRMIQLSGKSDSGKSTLAAVAMSQSQSQGVLTILWDSERKFQANRYDDRLGGSSKDLLLVRNNNIREGSRAVAHLVHAAKEIDPTVKILIVWDSVGATLNSTEDREDTEEYSKQPGVSAKEVSEAIHKFNKLMNKYSDKETGKETISLLVTNQTYSSIGIGPAVQIEKGGTTLYYLSSIIIQLSRKKDLMRTKDGKKYKFAALSRAKIKKNHLFDSAESIAELDIVVSAAGVQLASDVKSYEDLSGWDDSSDDDSDDE